jgi:hypothetical protein
MTTHSVKHDLTKDELLEHWQSEAESAFLYALLAPKMKEATSRAALERLSKDETAHQQHFEKLLGDVPSFRPSLRVRGFVLLANLLGPKFVLSLLRLEEGREVARFLREAKAGNTPEWLPRLARESAEHA